MGPSMLPFAVGALALALAPSARAGVEVGVGGAAGGALYEPQVAGEGGRSFAAAGSPLLSVQWDPWSGPVRPVFGLSSAPTFLYSMGYDAYSIPLAVGELGVSFGDDTTRATVGGHAGLFSFGAGARLTTVPWELGSSGKTATGVELRATWLARWGGYLGALWVVRFG